VRFEKYSRKSWDSLREIIVFDSAFHGIELVTNCEFHPGAWPLDILLNVISSRTDVGDQSDLSFQFADYPNPYWSPAVRVSSPSGASSPTCSGHDGGYVAYETATASLFHAIRNFSASNNERDGGGQPPERLDSAKRGHCVRQRETKQKNNP
jgi:hypothetical protein